MSALTFAAIDAGSHGPTAPPVLIAVALAVLSLPAFFLWQARSDNPMLPLEMFRSRTVTGIVVIGAAFMVCYYGMPFVMALNLQDVRGLSSLMTGVSFLPMMLIGLVLTPLSARIVEHLGRRRVITLGLLMMTVGLVGLALAPADAPVWVLAALMLLVGLGGPTVMPPATAALLGAVPAEQSGTASGVFNTGRQLSGALAVALFGALLVDPDTFHAGLRLSLLLAAAVALAAAGTARLLLPRT